MHYTDLRDFIDQLEHMGELKRITQPVSPILEMTEIADRTLEKGAPALLFENVTDGTTRYNMPVLSPTYLARRAASHSAWAHKTPPPCATSAASSQP